LRSWRPPVICAINRVPRRTHSAPVPFGPENLWPENGQQIHAERRDVERQLAGRLHGVRVEQRTARVGDRGELGDRLDGADFVVGEHHRHQRGAIGDHGGQGIWRHDAGSIDSEPADVPAAAGEGPRGLQDRFVLDGADHEMPPA
jgi:hypothetical protein